MRHSFLPPPTLSLLFSFYNTLSLHMTATNTHSSNMRTLMLHRDDATLSPFSHQYLFPPLWVGAYSGMASFHEAVVPVWFEPVTIVFQHCQERMRTKMIDDNRSVNHKFTQCIHCAGCVCHTFHLAPRISPLSVTCSSRTAYYWRHERWIEA